MRLEAALYRLPLRFDVERLQYELRQFDQAEWVPHPERPGHSALALVSTQGQETDSPRGPMLPTALLQPCPYIRQLLAFFNTVIGRARLMRLDAGAEITAHYDTNYYWHDRVRVHIPIVSHPQVRFHCGGHEVYIAPGEAWIPDTWRRHAVVNASGQARTHLVFDTLGSASFWDLVEQAERPFSDATPSIATARFAAFDPQIDPAFPTEQYCMPVVMPPAELAALISEAIGEALPEPGYDPHSEALSQLRHTTTRCLRDWRTTWAAHADRPEGWAVFSALRAQLLAGLGNLPQDLRVRSNGARLVHVLKPLFIAAFNPGFVEDVPRRRVMAEAL